MRNPQPLVYRVIKPHLAGQEICRAWRRHPKAGPPPVLPNCLKKSLLFISSASWHGPHMSKQLVHRVAAGLWTVNSGALIRASHLPHHDLEAAGMYKFARAGNPAFQPDRPTAQIVAPTTTARHSRSREYRDHRACRFAPNLQRAAQPAPANLARRLPCPANRAAPAAAGRRLRGRQSASADAEPAGLAATTSGASVP